MTTLKVFTGNSSPAHEVSGELSDRIKDVIYEYSGRMPLATAIGVLEIVKKEILDSQ